jgi:hypothetical protein
MTKKILDDMLEAFKGGKQPPPTDIELTEKEVAVFVRMKIDPKRFSPNIFDGEWALTNQHPTPGKVRVIKAITGNDEIPRLVARQGRFVYAYPWFK